MHGAEQASQLCKVLQIGWLVAGLIRIVEDHCGLGSVADVQYRENSGELMLDRLLLKMKFGGDLLVGPSKRHQPEYSTLSFAQVLGGRSRLQRNGRFLSGEQTG